MTRRERDPKPYMESTMAEKWAGFNRARSGGAARVSGEVIFYAGAAALLDLIHSPSSRNRKIAELGRELDEFARAVAEERRTLG